MAATETLYLHIGAHKTGSTSIQQSFYESRDALHRHGIDYFSYIANHSSPMFWLFSHRPERYHVTLRQRLSPAQLAARIREVDGALKTFLADPHYKTKIISGEDVSVLRPEEVAKIKAYLDEAGVATVKVIIYVRNYYEFLDSTVQELVKNGTPLRNIEESLNEGGLAAVPNYKFRIEKFRRLFGEENVDVRVFDTRLFPNRDLIADFCDAMGLPDLVGEITSIRANTSLARESVYILDQYNQVCPLVGEPGTLPRTELVKSYFGSPEGGKFRITEPKLVHAYDRAIADDRNYVRKLLGPTRSAYVIEKRDKSPGLDEATTVDMPRLFRGIGRTLLDLETYERGFDIAMTMAAGESEAEIKAAISRNIKFLNSDVVCRRLTQTFLKLEKLDIAAALAERAAEAGPNDTRNHALLANVRSRQEKWAEAAAALHRVLEIEPENALAYRRLSACLGNMADWQAAIDAGRKAVELAPDKEEFQRHLQRVHRAYDTRNAGAVGAREQKPVAAAPV